MTTIDLYFREANADDDERRHVGTVNLDDLGEIVHQARRWGSSMAGEPAGQFIDRGFEVVWVDG